MNTGNLQRAFRYRPKTSNKSSLNRKFATIFLVSMCIQYIPLEGFGVSYLKVAVMATAPVVWFWRVPVIRKSTLWSFLYFGIVLFSAVVWNENYRISTLIYLLLFLLTFNAYYNLVYKGAFSIDSFLQILKSLILAYVAVLIVQQIAILVGIRSLPLINLIQYLDRGLGSNSLALEPSHAARILTVAFYAYLKLNEIRLGHPLSLKQLFVDNKWLTLGFLYAMVTMGSGTAFIALLILSFYFLKRKYIPLAVTVVVLFFTVIPNIDYVPLNRALKAVTVTLEGDRKTLLDTDNSAAVRILPLLNTLQRLDLSSEDVWFGKGSDAANKLGAFSEKRMMGSINDYGLISFIIGLIFIFSCCLIRFFSIGTFLVFALVGFVLNNIAYIWGIYMLLVPIKYFHGLSHNKRRGFNIASFFSIIRPKRRGILPKAAQ